MTYRKVSLREWETSLPFVPRTQITEGLKRQSSLADSPLNPVSYSIPTQSTSMSTIQWV